MHDLPASEFSLAAGERPHRQAQPHFPPRIDETTGRIDAKSTPRRTTGRVWNDLGFQRRGYAVSGGDLVVDVLADHRDFPQVLRTLQRHAQVNLHEGALVVVVVGTVD